MTERQDGALFTCLASNKYGQDERNIKLLITEVPELPLDVRVGEIWTESASVTWTSPYNGNSPITKYIVYYWNDDAGINKRLQESELKVTTTSIVLKRLQAGTSYAVSVAAVNDVGYGEHSKPARFTTAEAGKCSKV